MTRPEMKITILIFTIFLAVLTTRGQTIQDFFIPNSPNNKITFYTTSSTGGRTSMTRSIYYVNKENYYEITNAALTNGKPTSIVTQTVMFSESEAKMNKSISTTIIETNKQRNHTPPIVLLIMPQKGQTKNWTYKQISGDLVKCATSWTTVIIDGQTLKAIKLEEEVVDGFGILIKYYVQGVGLWKTNFIGSDGSEQPMEKFDQLEYDSTVK